MEEKILQLLETQKAYSVKEIAEKLAMGENDVRIIIAKMCEKLLVYKNKKNKYVLFEKSNLLKGKVVFVKENYAFVSVGSIRDIFVSKNNLNGAENGDIVALQLLNESKDKCEGKIVKIAKHENKRYFGEIVRKKNKIYVVLDDKALNYTIILDNRTCNLVDGTKVVVELNKTNKNDYFLGSVVEVLGHKDDPGVDLLSVLKKYKIDETFPIEVINQVENINGEVSSDEIKSLLERGGKDLRNENVFTIDGDDTKDIDDALSITTFPNGNYNVKIHIANVSNYVQPYSPLFNEAVYKRGTSVYIPGANVPMLPRELSNGICSLNPNVDRLALTFDITYDKCGNLVNFDIYESVIRSRCQMTYKNVNKVIEGIIPEGYEDFIKDLNIMYELSKKLRTIRKQKGFIDFELEENKIILDENGKTKEITLYPRGEAEKLIEIFMIEAGEKTSNYLDENGYKDKHVYRVHGAPKLDKILIFKDFIKSLGYISNLKNCSEHEIQKELESFKDKKEYLVIAREMLKCMQKASYSRKNIGHFALVSLSTCQVTSPIRRAGDLVNHVLIKECIYKKMQTLSNTDLDRISQVASQTERNADDCEIAAKKIKMAEYMK